ncbi:MAG: anti-sigma regulatory factor [Planctomycetes bacterium]|nr:anti-sigma regulatory factor [Planctomycetota bacterium]
MNAAPTPPLPPSITLCVPARTDSLHLIRYVVLHGAIQFGFPEEDAAKIEMATDEACSNVIVHGYGVARSDRNHPPLYIYIYFEPDRILIRIVDKAKPFSPLSHGDVQIHEYLKQGKLGGLGIFIMKALVDEITHQYSEGEGNKLELVKFLPGRRPRKS